MNVAGVLIRFLGSLGNKNLIGCRSNGVIQPLQYQKAYLTTKDKLKDLKIPEKPKRPLSPYFRYLAEHRPKLQKQHPEWKIQQVAKECGKDWKTVEESVKKKYHEDYAKDMQLYSDTHREYIASLTTEQKEAMSLAKKEKLENKKKLVLRKRKRDNNMPKRPVISFLYFMKEKWALPENKSRKLPDMLKSYKEEWNSMAEEKKQKYLKLQKDDQERYAREMTEWEAKMVQEGNADIVRKESLISSTGPQPLYTNEEKKKK